MLTYEEVLAGIHSRKQFSSTPSLDRIRRLMERLGDPQKSLRVIHVAGTNGKGSVCALVESALRSCGFRVGLFTSPYLVDFRERIQVDRQMISREKLCALYYAVMAAEESLEREGYEPVNEFELVTALGFQAFRDAEVDFAVIEVGLGGRCDPTNLVENPAVCCITPISFDHTGVLGSTLPEIAGEKAGIIKPGRPVVTGGQAPEVLEVLEKTAKQAGAIFVNTPVWEVDRYDHNGLALRCGEDRVQLPLLGRYQAVNCAIAWEACRFLGIPPEYIARGFSACVWPGRLQLIPGEPEVLIDAGHNPAGIRGLSETLDELFPDRNIIAVMAMMRDKDYAACIPEIARRCKRLIGTTVQLPRSLPPEEIAEIAGAFCPTDTASSVAEGLSLARQKAAPGDLILVCGSVYAAGAALSTLS